MFWLQKINRIHEWFNIGYILFRHYRPTVVLYLEWGCRGCNWWHVGLQYILISPLTLWHTMRPSKNCLPWLMLNFSMFFSVIAGVGGHKPLFQPIVRFSRQKFPVLIALFSSSVLNFAVLLSNFSQSSQSRPNYAGTSAVTVLQHGMFNGLLCNDPNQLLAPIWK